MPSLHEEHQIMSKITSVHVGTIDYEPSVQWVGEGSRQIATIVRIELDNGLQGISVGWNDSPSATAMALTIEAWFATALVGLDIRTHPVGSESMRQMAAWHGSSCVAVAAIDNALWDAKAKSEGLPLHAVLGTRHAELPAYAVSRKELAMNSAEEIIDHMCESKEFGLRAYKPHLWGVKDRDIAGCEAFRRAMGEEFGLMLDPLGRYSVTDALAVGEAIQDLKFLWLEDPIPGAARRAYPWLAQRLSIPLIATDALQWSMSDYIDVATRQCPVGLRLDAGRQGVTFCRDVIEMAAPYGVKCEFHAYGPEPNSVTGLHVALAQRGLSHYEVCVPTLDTQIPGIDVPTRLNQAGRIAAPTRHGMGLEIDWDYLEPRISWVPRSPPLGVYRVGVAEQTE
jgi:L-alanine-DL-glutamate epimerase-like enolase superfamily enzyme